MRRARRQLNGPLALAGVRTLAGASVLAGAGVLTGAIVLAACSPGGDTAGATKEAAGAPPAASAAPSGAAPRPADPSTEATCDTAPLGARVVRVRRESPDSIRVELSLANLATADTWAPGSPAAAAAQAAVAALDQASVLSADGRRRMFALRGGTGARVGSPATVPAPGRSATFWTLFPAAEGEVSVLLPGFTPLAGLTVAPGPGQPEP